MRTLTDLNTVTGEVTAMPYANHDGIRIYYQVEGQGTPLVLQHGLADSLESWYELGYVPALRADYQLILVDARGHGASDKPHAPNAYGLHRRVGDTVAVLDALDIRQAVFWGYSMGGWIGFGLAKYAPERVQALIIGGQHPYARTSETTRQMVQRGMTQGPEAFVAGMEETFGALDAAYKARLLTADLEAFLAMTQDRPSLEAVLPTMPMPCCLYVGEQDTVYSAVKACRHQIPRVTFVSLPGLTHAEAFIRSDLVLPEVIKFLHAVPR
jgi:pimeloyl-ACP methyl ester carboxylesterase